MLTEARFECKRLNVGWPFSLRLAGTPPHKLFFLQPSHYLHFLALLQCSARSSVLEEARLEGLSGRGPDPSSSLLPLQGHRTWSISSNEGSRPTCPKLIFILITRHE